MSGESAAEIGRLMIWKQSQKARALRSERNRFAVGGAPGS
jgi:hypothetical protein